MLCLLNCITETSKCKRLVRGGWKDAFIIRAFLNVSLVNIFDFVDSINFWHLRIENFEVMTVRRRREFQSVPLFHNFFVLQKDFPDLSVHMET